MFAISVISPGVSRLRNINVPYFSKKCTRSTGQSEIENFDVPYRVVIALPLPHSEHRCSLTGAVPALFEADAVVLGGSFAGIAAALRLAEGGRRTVVVEPRTYMGREATATLRPWVSRPEAGAALPEPLRTVLAGHDAAVGGEAPLHPDRVKRTLEDTLAAKGVGWVYATLPIALLERDGRVDGVVVANKSGRQAIRCRAVIDATETALAAALAGEDTSAYGGGPTARYERTLEFTGVDAASLSARGDALDVPSSLGLDGGVVRLHRGWLGDAEGHVLVEFALTLPSGNDVAANRARELAARHAGMRLAAHLAAAEPAFAKAFLAASSHELRGPFPLAEVHGRGASLPAPEAYSTRLAGVAVLAKPMLAGIEPEAFHDPAAACLLGARAAEAALAGRLDASQGGAFVPSAASEETTEAALSALVPSLVRPRAGLAPVDVPAMSVPALGSADVLVVGGGSGGASASIAAAAEGAHTMLLELNPGLGGTGTFGGVDSYWFGRRNGFAAAIADRVSDVQRDIGYKGHKWNIEAKMYALQSMAAQAGVEPTFQAITFGALKRGDRVRGVVAATRRGPRAVYAEAIIDATGDGDVAAYAGASFAYGSEKDHTVMWYSLAQFAEPGKTKNNFTSMVDVTDVLDYTRAIVAGRRRGPACHDHGSYVATRESRHIVGDVTMRLTDQLLQRRWNDVVNVHFSNHDVKGVSGADWVNVGLIPPNLEIEIPYRMLLPAGLEGLLLAGKAISATHDALPAIRMQSDLENLGGVAALAAVMAVREGTTPRTIPIRALQERLVRDGLIPANALTRRLAPVAYGEAELRRLADEIEAKPLYTYAEMRMNEVYRDSIPFAEICSAGPRAVPVLERALREAEGIRKLHLAQALCMLGSTAGVPTLRDAILDAMRGDALPVRTADMMYVQLPPDHGAMPDAAYWLYALAPAADVRSVAAWERTAELVRPTEDDFKDSMLGLFYYVDAVCQGAERLGDRAALPALERLHRVPLLRGQQAPEGAQPDYFLERRTMLELSIGRAMARCGGAAGYDVLIAYLSDSRTLLAKNALLQLRRLSGRDYGFEADAWARWVLEKRPYLRTAPDRTRLDFEFDASTIARRDA